MRVSVIVLLFCTTQALGAYYSTLPKGVRNFTYRYIKTGEICGDFGSSGKFEGYDVRGNINAESIEGMEPAIDTFLQSMSKEDYDNFSLGTFEGAATSKIEAHVFGGGWGITNRLTAYGHVGYYNAEVDLNLKRTKKGQKNVEGMGVEVENLPEIDERIVQSFFVNYMGYKPLGKWRAKDFGDTELGLMYRLTSSKKKGMKITAGVVAPTGRDDNPDILQDIGFGDGQWDAFGEIGGGYRYRWFSLDSWVRYDHQFKTTKRLRLPESEDFPVTSESGDVEVKYGNKITATVNPNIHVSREVTISPMYIFYYKEKDRYRSKSEVANKILEKNTEEISHTLRMEMTYSTVSKFMRKKFPAPMDFKIMYQRVIAGRNTPKYDRIGAQISFYF